MPTTAKINSSQIDIDITREPGQVAIYLPNGDAVHISHGAWLAVAACLPKPTR